MKKYYVTWQTDRCDTGTCFVTEIDGEVEMPAELLMETAFLVEGMEPEDYTIMSIIRTETPAISY